MSGQNASFPESDTRPSAEVGTKKKRQNGATGASAAGIRAVSSQMLAFYFRAPIKAFFRARVDYMAFPRAINPRIQANAGWSWATTTPGLLAHAVREHGWSFIPNQVLPPMLANVTVGAVLYTSYLQTLGLLHEESYTQAKRLFPPPPASAVFSAGCTAGAVQSLVAAPLDALQVRFQTSDMLENRYSSMWHYARDKLRSIGIRGVFAGYSLSFVKDTLGSGVFFASFEYTKNQGYYHFLTWYYGRRMDPFRQPDLRSPIPKNSTENPETGRLTIRPHYALEPAFLLAAGITASLTSQVIQHPLGAVQEIHYGRLESLDYAARQENAGRRILRLYYHAYQETLEQCSRQAKLSGGWMRWLYRGFWLSTIRQVPSTSAGLIVFELVRRKYGEGETEKRIHKDGFDILLR